MITTQQRWNRYVDALNSCIRLGYYIACTDTKTPCNVKYIEVYNPSNKREATIRLKPKKYKFWEMYELIRNRVGCLD